MRPFLFQPTGAGRVKPNRRGFFKSVLGVVVCTATFALVPQAAAAANEARKETLQSINRVENPRDSMKPGLHGELGPYQFRSKTWAMHTRRPFADALNRTASDEVAVIHYEWIKAGLLRAGVSPSAYNIALAWNAGVSAVVNGRAPRVSHDYARRVSNLTADQLRGKQIAAN